MVDHAPAWYVTSAFERLGAFRERPALLHRGTELTYGELLDEIHRTARALERHGLRRCDGLVLIARNSPEAFVVRFAAFLLGLRFTSLFPDTTDDLAYVVTDVRARALVVESPDQAVTGDDGLLTFSLDGGAGIDLRRAAAAEPATPVDVSVRESDIARVQYTGGTTGRPKGVPSTYAAFGAAARAWGGGSRGDTTGAEWLMPEGARFVLATPFAHGSGDAAFSMLRMGAAVEILDGFDPAEFAAAVARAPFAMTYLYPSWLYRLLDHADTTGADLSPLRFVGYGSAPASPARTRQALARFGPNLMQTYATTEAPAIAMLDQAGHAAALAGRPELLESVGMPLPGSTVTILRPDGTPSPTGEVGEVCVAGPSIMTGYWNHPELDAGVLRDGLLHTGDLGRIDADGYLYLVGRLKDMIIVEGHNHYAGPIEDVLAAHPAVREAAVVGRPDRRTGEAVHAFVVARDGEKVDPDELRAWADERLVAGAAPVTVTVLDALPLTTMGKPDKNLLRDVPRGT